MRARTVAAIGVLAAAATIASTAALTSVDGGFWLRVLFVACWLVAAVIVASRADAGVAGAVAVLALICFPVSFSGVAVGIAPVNQLWHVLGPVALVAFLYLFPRGQFEPRWASAAFAASAAYLVARAAFSGLARWPVDLIVFPVIFLVPLGLQIVHFRSGSNPEDRRQVRIVGLTSGGALLGMMVAVGLLLSGLLGTESDAELILEPVMYALSLLIPVGITLAVVPVGDRVGQVMDRLTGPADDVGGLVTQLTGAGPGVSSGTDLLTNAATAIGRSLRLPAVAFDLATTSEHNGKDESHASGDETWMIAYRGAPIAGLRVTPRAGTRLSDGDRRLLDRLSRQMAPMVGAALLADQLDAAERRLLRVREEERRRLRADLHDELGAALAGLTPQTGLASALLDREPGATRRLLGEIESGLQSSVARVRQLVEGLRPAHLDELGLDAAIREQAERLVPAGSPIQVFVHGHTDPGLPAAVELAAYRIAQEALTNAVRHSGGTRVDIQLEVVEPEYALSVRVVDDGVGLSSAEPLGFGIQSMRQRAREVGGECTITQAGSCGVAVTATMPLSSVDVA